MVGRHAPGPWEVGPEDAGFGHIVVGYAVVGPGGKRIAAVDLDGNEPVGLDNARLIAAAPDLLEALKDLLASPPLALNGWEMRKAREAIAKAEGDA